MKKIAAAAAALGAFAVLAYVGCNKGYGSSSSGGAYNAPTSTTTTKAYAASTQK